LGRQNIRLYLLKCCLKAYNLKYYKQFYGLEDTAKLKRGFKT